MADGAFATGRPYAERSDQEPGWHDRIAETLLAVCVRPVRRRIHDPARSLRGIVPCVEQLAGQMRALSDQELIVRARGMRTRLRQDGFTLPLVAESFALTTEAASRTLGHRHYPSQLMAGWGLLQGRLVEMATGEGKTFAATLPAVAVALAGYPVHVVTVNDYLAGRDAEEMGPVYGRLGLTCGAVIQGMPRGERREIYGRSIVYCTNKELAFDYLRDRVALSERSSELHLAIDRMRGGEARSPDLVLRGLHYAIVDEADSVFIDEARTPLILSASAEAPGEQLQCEQALDIAGALTARDHFNVELADRSIRLETAGKAKIAELCEDMGGVWTSIRAREELVSQALTALLLYRRDQQYVVVDGKVQIVDESTGRVMPDRSWERGLHQLIEVKEQCEITEQRQTLARLTYQRLFRRYVRLSGMTGTGLEVAGEIRSVFGLDVVQVPLHRPSRRVYGKSALCLTRQEKWERVASRVRRLTEVEGRPVLIGTRSVGASEEISAILTECGIEHALLNAKQDGAEAEIVSQAGLARRVTVATNMAGRGTDIALGPGVAERGGLHVILTEFHESRRIDRQLFGRGARQGDPGGCEAILSLEDDLFTVFTPRGANFVAGLLRAGLPVQGVALRVLRWRAQRAAEKRGREARVSNLRMDRGLDQMLAFSGRGE